MILSRPLHLRRAPGGVLHPLGASAREALRAPRRVWVFNGVLALACVAVWVVAIGGLDVPAFGDGPVLAWYWLALGFYLAEVLVVHLQFRKQAHTLSLTEIGLTLGLLLGAPSQLLIGQLVGTLVALVVNRRRSQLRQLAKFAFNLASYHSAAASRWSSSGRLPRRPTRRRTCGCSSSLPARLPTSSASCSSRR